MRKKQFTLTELIVSIVVLSILLSIVLINFLGLKKEAVKSSMSQNISIIQGEIDTFYLNNEKYPILDEKALTLETPQLIDINALVEKGMQKEKLDTSKIKEQYYWVDVFGKVWGSTRNDLDSINLIESEEGNSVLEWLVNSKYKGYKIYETIGYSASKNPLSTLEANSSKDPKFYKMISEIEINLKRDSYVNYPMPNRQANYLVSMIDEYGLESAPRGKFSNQTTFRPLINYEGEYEFEIEGQDLMYWIDFQKAEYKPGNATIDYLFKVKDFEGKYSDDWTSDFFSLDNSKGIKIKVVMKSDREGNKPSLYDLRIIFKYKEDEIPPKLIPESGTGEELTNNICPKYEQKSDFSKYSKGMTVGQKGKMIFFFNVDELETIEETVIPKPYLANAQFKELGKTFYISEEFTTYTSYSKQNTAGKCMVVVYEIEITSVSKTITEDKTLLCGAGGSVSNRRGSESVLVYNTYLEKGQFLTRITKPMASSGWILTSIEIEVSHKGADFVKVKSISEVKDESCVNLVFKYKMALGFAPESPSISICAGEDCQPIICDKECTPVCKEDCVSSEEEEEVFICEKSPEKCETTCLEYEGECVPPVCNPNCSVGLPTKPEASDTRLNDPEWTTVDSVRFFGHGAKGQLTRWYDVTATEDVKDSNNTRIEYRYAKSNGTSWSRETLDFEKIGIARSVMAVAYIQVRTTELKKVEEVNYPKITSLKFLSEQGYLDASMITPTLAIMAIKDNNANRDIYSSESNLSWDYFAADPRNKKIVDVEWSGDIRTKYPVGTYEIKARVKNEVNIWSEWVTYPLQIVEEKPTAVITTKPIKKDDLFYMDEKIIWSIAQSFDPDGDKIVNYEWSSNKKDKYSEGVHTISLRVQDSEGYWSDVETKTITVVDKKVKAYRLEAEDTTSGRVVPLKAGHSNALLYQVSAAEASNNALIYLAGGYRYHMSTLTFKFEGTGFSLKLKDTENLIISIDDVEVDRITQLGEFNYDQHGLQEGPHKLTLTAGEGIKTYIDYLDVYKTDLRPNVESISFFLKQNSVIQPNEINNISIAKGNSLVVRYKTLNDSTVNSYIKDSKGNKIATLDSNKFRDGGSLSSHELNWIPTSDLSTGVYKFTIELTGVDGKSKSSFEKDFSISNEVPIQRIEAEDSTKTTVSKTDSYAQQIIIAEGYSGTGYRFAKSVTFGHTFVGTGLDLLILNTRATTVRIDGVIYNLLDSTEPYLFSVKNLPLGTHKLEVIGNQTKIDYIDIYSTDDKVTISNAFLGLKHQSSAVIATDSIPLNNNNLSLQLDYLINKTSYITVNLKDSSGKIVKSIVKNELKTGGTLGDYNVITKLETSIPSGQYIVELIAKGVLNQETTVKELNLYVDQKNPSLRIEAEDSTKVKVYNTGSSYYRVSTDASASAGKVLSFPNNNIMTVSINGTGFDIRMVDTANAPKLTIDGTVVYSMAKPAVKGETFISVRGLKSGPHVVQLTVSGIIDYIDVVE